MTVDSDNVVLHLKRTWRGVSLLNSFFATLEKVKQDINDDRIFRLWCIDNLGVSVDEIVRVSGVLNKVDSARIKKEFAQARKAGKQRKKLPCLMISYYSLS